MMRRILVDHARRHHALERPGASGRPRGRGCTGGWPGLWRGM